MKPGLISRTLCTDQTGLQYMFMIYLNRVCRMLYCFLPMSMWTALGARAFLFKPDTSVYYIVRT
jgi:hypothetical protein